jgi:type IV pilus assembly protein PilY1
MKDALKQIITDVEDINLGLMRFTDSEGGPVLFPITYIDADSGNSVSEPSVTNPAYTTRIVDGANDAEEVTKVEACVAPSGGICDLTAFPVDTVYLSDTTLDISVVPEVTGGGGGGGGTAPPTSVIKRVAANSDDAFEDDGEMELSRDSIKVNKNAPRHIGVRFTGVTVPPGATITSAFLDFWIERKKTADTNIKIFAQNVDNPATFSSSDNDISSRSYTSAVDWNGVASADDDVKITSPDIKSLVQTIVNRGFSGNPGNWASGNAIAFKLEASKGNRVFWSREGESSRRPKLRIEYGGGAVAAADSIPGMTMTTGLRFPVINIPQGATVTSASLELTPSATYTGGVNAISIKLENVDDSLAFSTIAKNISSRLVTSGVTWTPANGEWDSGVATETPVSVDLKAEVQKVVNRAGYCGGNAMSFILKGDALAFAKSFENSASEAAVFKYSYDATTGSCFNESESSQVSAGSDDAEQSGSAMTRFSNSLDLAYDTTNGNTQTVGIRFQNVVVPKNASIIEAAIEFRAKGASSGATTLTFKGEAADDAAAISSSNNDITDRTSTTASVNWVPDPWTTDKELFASPDLKTIVQEIVNRTGWASNNSMLFKITGSGTNLRSAYSFDGDPNAGPRLRIKYGSTGGGAVKTVRARMLELVDSLPASGFTPITETLYEAAHYWRGEEVVYGKSRDSNSKTRLSHPASYCTADNACRGANTSSFPPYGVDNPSSCPETTNLDDFNCSSRAIVGSPKYISPFKSTLTCVSNYQVLLTDGEANRNEVAPTIAGEFGLSCINTKSNGSSVTSGEKCAIDMSKFLRENDQSTATVGDNLDNDQIVSTYTIGFDTGSLPNVVQFLKDIATEGGGQFFEAQTAGQLTATFQSILTEVKKDPTSFVAPSLATNAFNRLLSRDEVYFGLFTPSLNVKWLGNVKKYGLCIDSSTGCTLGTILNSTGGPAVDPIDNKFKPTTKSVWSDVIDGRFTTKGGHGAEMTDYTDRIFYTDTTSGGTPPTNGTALSSTGFKITSANWNDTSLATVRSIICPTPSTSAGSDCEDRMLWMLGKINIADVDNDVSATTRWTVNDVLHSSPLVLTYGGEDTTVPADGTIDIFYDKLLFGTNNGGLSMVNSSTGKEEWAFMPESLLPRQQSLFTNPEGIHIYGFDMTPQLRIEDVNFNGTIDPATDKIHAYMGMRRGGDYIYALDLTPASALTNSSSTIIPKFLYRIDGGTGDFTRLTDTWSSPQFATINAQSGSTTVEKNVLIFGGGYDNALDGGFGTTVTGGSANMGNAIYIVDADTGAKILSISGSSGHDIIVPNMNYSIAADISINDTNGDGLADRLYVGDTAGQIWRVDLAGDIKLTGGAGLAGSSVVGRLANISDSASLATQRRFFEKPSVIQVLDTTYSDAAGGEYDYILLGTGNRAHPLNKDVDDRFYAFRDNYINAMPDLDSNNLADTAYSLSVTGGPITDSDMFDITSTTLEAALTADPTNTNVGGAGWYFDFTAAGNDGEKVLSSPITLAGLVTFTTYRPDALSSVDACAANVGGGAAFNFDVLTSKAALDWDGDGTLEDTADRSMALGGGIPSDVVPIFTKEGVVGIVGIEGGAAQLGTLTGLPRYRTYWYEDL